MATLKRYLLIHNHQHKHSHRIRKNHLCRGLLHTRTGGATSQHPRPQHAALLVKVTQSGTRVLCLSQMPSEAWTDFGMMQQGRKKEQSELQMRAM